jgi:hypothetical protein
VIFGGGDDFFYKVSDVFSLSKFIKRGWGDLALGVSPEKDMWTKR